jgi:hypothetical protein
MSSAAISYDFDADPANRKAMPLFYGYLPDDGTKRGVMYLCMVANGALMLLLRSIGVAMILFVNAKWCIAYFLGDYLLYFVYKLVRADFTYWLPTSSLQADVLISFTFRLFAKLVCDYTGVLQFRGGGELGGLYYSVNTLTALLTPIIGTTLYVGSRGEDEVGGGGEERDLWSLVLLLGAAWLAVFFIFVLLMKKEYRHTFWSTMTGNDYVQSYVRARAQAKRGREQRSEGGSSEARE